MSLALFQFDSKLITALNRGLKLDLNRGLSNCRLVYVIVAQQRPRKMDLTTLHMAMTAMNDPESCAQAVAQKLGMTTATLYTYVNGDGSVKEAGQRLLDKTTKSSLATGHRKSASNAKP